MGNINRSRWRGGLSAFSPEECRGEAGTVYMLVEIGRVLAFVVGTVLGSLPAEPALDDGASEINFVPSRTVDVIVTSYPSG